MEIFFHCQGKILAFYLEQDIPAASRIVVNMRLHLRGIAPHQESGGGEADKEVFFYQGLQDISAYFCIIRSPYRGEAPGGEIVRVFKLYSCLLAGTNLDLRVPVGGVKKFLPDLDLVAYVLVLAGIVNN